ncbi:MAG: hypothetical protein WAX77_10350 [Methylococcaceae bacterium]
MTKPAMFAIFQNKNFPFAWLLILSCWLILGFSSAQAVTLNKNFSPVSVNPGDTPTLTISIFNDQTFQLTSVGWSDTMPTGMKVNGSVISNTCGGTVTATLNSNVISLSGGTVNAKSGSVNGQCDVLVPITTTVQGNNVNTIPASNLTNTQGLTNTSSASATLQVSAFTAPGLSTTLSPSTIYIGQSGTLTVSVTNNDVNGNLTQTGWAYTLPTGLQVNGTLTTNGNCGSPTLTGTSGTTAIGMSGATIIKGGTVCTITIPITGNAQGNYSINLPASVITDYQGVTNATGSGQAIAVQSFQISKSFSPTTVKTNQTSVMTVTIISVGAYNTLAFSDNFSSQTGLVIAPTPNATTTCNASTSPSITATAGTQLLALSNGSIAAGTYVAPSTCTVSVNVVVPANTNAGTKTNSLAVGSVTGKAVSNGISASNINATSANLTVNAYTSPTLTKSFSKATAYVGEIVTLTIAVKNNDTTTFTNVGWTDTLPTGLKVATGSVTTSAGCTGTPLVTAPVNGGSIQLSGASIASNATCTITVPVSARQQGAFSNSMAIGAITDDQGTSNTSLVSASLTARTLTVAKTFNGSTPATGNVNDIIPMVITISNFSTDSYGSLAMTDNFSTSPSTLPTTLKVASPNGLVNNCGGTATATAGASAVTLTGGSLGAGTATTATSCTITVNVKGTATFTNKDNTIAAATGVTATSNGINNNNASTSANNAAAGTARLSLSTFSPPVPSKSFSPSTVSVGQTSTLTIGVQNADNVSTLTGVNWTDTLPTGLKVAATPAVTQSNCGTATFNPTAGNTSLSFSGGTIAPLATCTVTVAVVADRQSTGLVNTIAANAINDDQAIKNTASASATLITRSFGVTKTFDGVSNFTSHPGLSIPIKILISNYSTDSYTAVTFSDNFASAANMNTGTNLVIDTPNGLVNTCGGTATATAGSTTISLSGGALTAGASGAPSTCYIQVNVKSATGLFSNKTNNIAVGTITATASSNSTSASNYNAGAATLSVTAISNPTVSKSFNKATISIGENTTATITVNNTDTITTLTGVSWTDSLPVGLIVNGAATYSGSCGTPTIVTSPNTSIVFSSGTIAPSSSCTVTVPITATQESAAGYVNNININAINDNEGAKNTSAGSSGVLKAQTLTLSKAFGAGSINVGASTTLTITVGNPSNVAYSSIGFTDTLPTGLVVASTPNASTTCTGGTVTATANSGTVSLSGASITAATVTPTTPTTCTVTVTVTGNTSGTKANSITPANFSATGPNGATTIIANATASLTVNAATLSAAETFTPSTILADGTSSTVMQLVITNNNNQALTGVGFTNNLSTAMATGVKIASSGSSSNSCGGTLTATSGGTSISLSGGSIPALGNCTVSVPIVSTVFLNAKANAITVNATTSGGQAVSGNASATLTATVLSVSKSFANSNILVGGSTNMTITITNNSSTAQSSVAFTDTFPKTGSNYYILVSSPSVYTNTCNGTFTATALANNISLSGGTIPANSSCSIVVSVDGNTSGSNKTNTVSVTSSQQTTGVSASATFSVINPSISINTVNKSFAAPSIDLLSTSTASVSWSSNSTGTTVNPILTDNLPVGLTVSTVPNVTASCSGAIQPTIANTTISSARDQIIVVLTKTQAKNETCTVSFSVTPSKPGTLTNTIAKGDIVSADGTTAANTVTKSANLTVTNVLTIAKAFQPTILGPGGTSVLTITLTNPETLALTGASLTDSLPNGTAPNNLVIANPSNASTNCTIDGSPSSSLVTATAGTRAITLTNGVIPPKVGSVNGICTINVTVKPNGSYSSGSATNTIAISALSTTEGRSNINATSDTITFSAPSLGVVKDFNPTLVTGGSVSVLTVTISNPAAYTQSGLAFTDAMPSGMTIGSPPNPTTTCTGGTFSGVTVGSGTWSFSGGSVAANSSCTVKVNATSNIDGNLTNTIGVGAVTSSNGGANTQAASASLSNLPGASIGKSFAPNPSKVNETVRLTITITNSSSTTAITQMVFNDDFTLGGTQTGLTVAGTPNISNTCGGSISTTTTSISLSNGSLAKQASCIIGINVLSNTVGSYTNTIPASALSTNEGVTNLLPSTDTLPVYASIRAVKQLSPTSDAGRFVLTMTPSAPSGVSSRTNVGNDSSPSSVTSFFADEGTTYTLTETGQGLTDLNNYVTTYQCVNANGTTVTSGSGTSLSVTPPTTASGATKNQQDITCTFSNTRKTTQATVNLKKTWVSGIVNDAVTVSGTGLTSLNSVVNTGNETDTGSSVSMPVGSVIPLSETFTTGSASNYTTTVACTGTTGLSGSVSTAGNTVNGGTLTVGDTDSAIECTFTNTRSSVTTVTLEKQWSGATLNDAISFTATRAGGNLTPLASVANTASDLDAAVPQTVNTGDVITLGETFTTGSASNYTSSLACTGNNTPLSGNTLTINSLDDTIVCTQTNVRKTATVTLKKQWTNASIGDVVDVTGTGGATLTTLHSVANIATQLDTGVTDTINTGSVITLGETFTTGSASDYTSSWACTGTSGLSGNTLTIGSSDTAIVCTLTNNRHTANVTLKKTWVNANVNDEVNVTGTGLTTLDSIANSANETDTGATSVVVTGDVITLDESFTTGSASNYTATWSCTGTTGLSGTVLTVGSADTNITCTVTNTRSAVALTLKKTWVNATVNDAVNVTGTGLTTLNAVANTANETDTGIVDSVNINDVINLSETFISGSASNYTTTWACTGTSGLSGNTLTVGASDAAIVCTATNTHKTATVTLKKTWVDAIVNNAATLTGTGLTSLNSIANTANETDTGTVDTVTTGSVITLGENFTTGLATDYTATWACTGTSGLSGNTLTVGVSDTAIVCTATNTFSAAAPSIVLNKISLGDVNTFGYTLSNTTTTTGTVTTDTIGASKLVDTYTVSSLASDVTITEDVMPLGWTLTSATCKNTSNATVGSLTGSVYTITNSELAYGESYTCTFTNSKIPTVKVQKTTVGGFGGAFSFTKTNLVGTPSQILTTAPNQIEPAFATSIYVSNIGTDVTITENAVSGFSPTSASCSDANYLLSGNPSSSFGALGGGSNSNVLTIPATNVVAGATISCIFTNTSAATASYAITGKVFQDSGTGAGTANNAIQDGNETGIAGVTVKLTNCANTTYSTAITDGAGSYSLSPTSVPAGAVCVEETNLTGYSSIGANVNDGLASGYTLPSADKIRFTLASNTSYGLLNFADVAVNQFTTDGTQTSIPGATLNYPHTFIAGTGGTVAFSLPGATAMPNKAGWTETLYIDVDCNGALDSSETLNALSASTNTPVTAGQTICLIQKEFVPAGITQGANNLVPVRATFVYTNATVATTTIPVAIANAILSRQDLTTVSNVALVLRKEVSNVTSPTTPVWKTSNTAKSGEVLEYRLTYTNNGPDEIEGTSLTINDATPAFTTFVSALCETAIDASPTTLGTCALTKNIHPTKNTGTLKWSFTPKTVGDKSSLPSAASGAVTYRVKVD